MLSSIAPCRCCMSAVKPVGAGQFRAQLWLRNACPNRSSTSISSVMWAGAAFTLFLLLLAISQSFTYDAEQSHRFSPAKLGEETEAAEFDWDESLSDTVMHTRSSTEHTDHVLGVSTFTAASQSGSSALVASPQFDYSLDDLLIGVVTGRHHHATRVAVIRDSWVRDMPHEGSNVLFFSDTDLIPSWLSKRMGNSRIINIKSIGDAIDALLKPPASLLETIIRSLRRWWDPHEERGKVYSLSIRKYFPGLKIMGNWSAECNAIHGSSSNTSPAFCQRRPLWYVLMDDDTWLYPTCLVDRMLRRFNSSDALFLGQRCSSRGHCGGAGLVLSQSALDRLLVVLDSCLVEFDSHWYSDVIVTECLELRAHIPLTEVEEMNSQPPLFYELAAERQKDRELGDEKKRRKLKLYSAEDPEHKSRNTGSNTRDVGGMCTFHYLTRNRLVGLSTTITDAEIYRSYYKMYRALWPSKKH